MSRLAPLLAGACAVALLAVAAGRAAPRKAPAKPAAPAPRKPAPPAPVLPRVDTTARTVEIDAAVAKREHDDVLEGAIEYLLVSRGGKAYESVFQTDVRADHLHEALQRVGLKPGRPPAERGGAPTGPGVRIEAVWKEGGAETRVPVEELVLDVVAGAPLAGLAWVYTGSRVTEDPNTNRPVLMASQTKNLVSTHREDATVLLMNPLPEASGRRYKRNDRRLPKVGTPVRLVFRPAAE